MGQPPGRFRPAPRYARLMFEVLEMRALVTHMIGDHIHPRLRIVIDGVDVTIPSDIGLTPGKNFHPHTHDALGVLHIGEGPLSGLDPEGSSPRLTTLKDFFDVWRTTNAGTPRNNPDAFFSSTQILNRTADATHQVQMTVNGVPNFEFENYAPHDEDEIVIRFAEIEAENGRPTANPQTLDVLFGSPLAITLTGDDGDLDVAQPLTFRIASLPSHGVLRDSGGGQVAAGTTLSTPNVTYTPGPQFAGSDGFSFVALDAQSENGMSAPAAVSLDVAPNAAPTAIDQAVNVRFNTPRSITLGGDDGEPNVQQQLSFRVQTLPENGMLRNSQGAAVTAGAALPDAQVTYVPNDGFQGADGFTFTVQDDGGVLGGGQDASSAGLVTLQIVNSLDPNDILGPEGLGAERGVRPTDSLPLKIRFENYAQATAPAQEVVVQTSLDADLDWSSFQFGDIGFGPTVLDVPDGARSFESTLDLPQPDGSNLLLTIDASLNADTGVATWRLQATDPATGGVPEDPLAGFLPPNQSDHRGEGFLDFTVQPRADRELGTRIEASAAITFDNNPALRTNELFYTIIV